MNRQLYNGILVVALLGGVIDSTATHAARLEGGNNPSFIDYGKGQVNSDFLLVRLKEKTDQGQLDREIAKSGLKLIREFTLVPGLKLLAMPKSPAKVQVNQQRLKRLLATKRSL